MDSLYKPSDELVSVIVPVHNEGDQILENLDLLISEIQDHFTHFEILVISDGSTDHTNEELLKVKHTNVRTLALSANEGKGAAIRHGFKWSRGKFIFFIDGGMELHPRELRIFFGLMRLYDADIVIGSKRHPQSQIEYPVHRKLLSFIYQQIIKSLFKVNVTDTQVGIKLFKREVIESVLPHLSINRYGFDLEIISIANRIGFTKCLEAPIRLDYFSKNHRNLTREIWHVFRIGFSLLSDTLKLYFKLQTLPTKSTDQRNK